MECLGFAHGLHFFFAKLSTLRLCNVRRVLSFANPIRDLQSFAGKSNSVRGKKSLQSCALHKEDLCKAEKYSAQPFTSFASP